MRDDIIRRLGLIHFEQNGTFILLARGSGWRFNSHMRKAKSQFTRNPKRETDVSKLGTLFRSPRRKGFTLIELLIVIGIIGVLIGVAVPVYKSSIRKANEAAAVTTLSAIRVAQAKYVVDHKGQYGTFRELFEEGYLDKRFNYEQPHERGYVFVITLIPKSEDKAAAFSVNANPEQSQGIGATGKNFYYLDADSGICFSKLGPATAADETL
jgi:prepilin-type N-terminal cleavage/methylation domain-containing protein